MFRKEELAIYKNMIFFSDNSLSSSRRQNMFFNYTLFYTMYSRPS